MRKVAVGVFILLFVLHHDFWNWDNRNLVFGFIPAGLAYHAAFSIAAALLWLFTIKFAWPTEVEEWAKEGDVEGAGTTDGKGGQH